MVNDVLYEYRPDVVSPPGETLEEILEDLGMSQADLAERTGRPKKTINEIIRGKATITPETAIQFERVLGSPASFWLEREKQYREFLARQRDDESLAEDVDWLDNFPIETMAQQGWIEKHTNRVDQLRELLSFFRISTRSRWETTNALFRQSRAFEMNPDAVSAWLQQGERLARDIRCAPYDKILFEEVLQQARTLSRAPFEIARAELVHLCAQAGVAFVIVPELPQTRVYGATRWLAPRKALIQLSLRYKTDDQFWFSFFHEAAHILLHGKKRAFLHSEDDTEDQCEIEANQFATEFLIPSKRLEQLIHERREKYFSQALVEHFAEELHIAPGIVVGRLQHEGQLPRTHLNKLKRPVALKDI